MGPRSRLSIHYEHPVQPNQGYTGLPSRLDSLKSQDHPLLRRAEGLVFRDGVFAFGLAAAMAALYIGAQSYMGQGLSLPALALFSLLALTALLLRRRATVSVALLWLWSLATLLWLARAAKIPTENALGLLLGSPLIWVALGVLALITTAATWLWRLGRFQRAL